MEVLLQPQTLAGPVDILLGKLVDILLVEPVLGPAGEGAAVQEGRESLAFQVERAESAFNPTSMARQFILAVEAEEEMILRQLLSPEAWVEAVLALLTMDLPVLSVEWRGHQTQVEAAGVVLLPVIGPEPAALASSSYATSLPYKSATSAARTITTTAVCA